VCVGWYLSCSSGAFVFGNLPSGFGYFFIWSACLCATSLTFPYLRIGVIPSRQRLYSFSCATLHCVEELLQLIVELSWRIPKMDSERTPLLRQPPYTVFSTRQKLFVIIVATAASVFSPLSANIYFPALQKIRKELNVTEDVLNLTITSYMVRSISIVCQNGVLT
jgi:hypothetical protein